jgi:hypothetical protein
LSHPAFRLLAIITANSYSSGWCDLNNQQLAEMMNVSRQYVSSLLRELAIDLVSDTTLDGKRCLKPTLTDDSSPWRGDLDGRGLFETVDGTIEQQALPDGRRASRSSRTPHKILSTGDNSGLSTGDNINGSHEEEENKILIESSSSEGGGLSTGDNIKKDMLLPVDNSGIDAAFGRVAARWCHYFGDISPVVADLLGDFLDDPELAGLAAAVEESPEAWLMAAIEETGLAEARNPAKYFRKVLSDWIRRGYRTPQQQGDNRHAASKSDHQQDAPASLDGRAAIEAILDRFESGEIDRDEAKRQLAAYGVVL